MQEGSDDACVYLPYTTVMRLSNTSTAQSYIAIMTDESKANDAKAVMEASLYNLFKSENAYYVYSASEFLEEMNKMIHMVIVILTGIASISLLVGGIGIMNIMLVTVTERTREIGIRRAIGAERSSIVIQFLIEAAMLCGIGGIIGILIGTGGSLLVGWLMFQMTIYPAAWITLCAFTLSVALGILFGIYPAAKAARLQPVEALRAE